MYVVPSFSQSLLLPFLLSIKATQDDLYPFSAQQAFDQLRPGLTHALSRNLQAFTPHYLGEFSIVVQV